jgi:hypothetical protein
MSKQFGALANTAPPFVDGRISSHLDRLKVWTNRWEGKADGDPAEVDQLFTHVLIKLGHVEVRRSKDGKKGLFLKPCGETFLSKLAPPQIVDDCDDDDDDDDDDGGAR